MRGQLRIRFSAPRSPACTFRTPLFTKEISRSTARLFSELAEGGNHPSGQFVLNTGDLGLLKSLDLLSADEASDSVDEGATIAGHARHVTYGGWSS